MAVVVELVDGEDSLEDEPCYIVARDPTGRFYIADPELGFARSARVSSLPVSGYVRDATIKRALEYADKHGFKAVYVVP